jgi:glutathione S-transferase
VTLSATLWSKREMILIGQYDSSFVRRVGIALKLYGLSFEHRPWSVFSDKHKIRPLNPLMRVPTLMLDDEDVLFDSHLIIAHLETLVPQEQSLWPAEEPYRHRAQGRGPRNRPRRQGRQPFLRAAAP